MRVRFLTDAILSGQRTILIGEKMVLEERQQRVSLGQNHMVNGVEIVGETAYITWPDKYEFPILSSQIEITMDNNYSSQSTYSQGSCCGR